MYPLAFTHIHRWLYQILFSLELSISEKAMTEDLSGSLLCQEEEKLRSLIEEWHTFVSQSAASNEDLVWQIFYFAYEKKI